jgi:predicted Zn-dependent peptidase
MPKPQHRHGVQDRPAQCHAPDLDESFKLLSGMMAAPNLSESDIRTEVPIVLAEKRERGGTQEHVSTPCAR